MVNPKQWGWVLLQLFFLSILGSVAGQDNYPPEQLDALQSLWAEWNKSTPDLDSNLAGWNSTQRIPCWQVWIEFHPNWRGVQCLELNCNDTTNVCDGYIIGLILNNASIIGQLPAEIGNISTLATLELTGNPDLTGPLPQAIQYPYLYTLDLHDNGFNGTLPDLPLLYTLLNVDLSGNQFIGGYPYRQIREWTYLQILNLARNHFNGSIPSDAFVNMTQLESLDLSANNFIGPLPNLSIFRNMQSLVLSNNSFNGSLPDLKMLDNLRTLRLDYNNLTGNFPLSSLLNSSSVNNTLSILDLSGNQLTGSVTNWNGSDLRSLEELYLDNTSISGTLDVTQLIASGLVKSESMNGSGGLRILSMMNTAITNVIYAEGSIESITTLFRLQGNPYCQKDADDGTRCFCEQYCRNKGSMSNKKVVIIAAATSTVLVFLVILVVVSAVLYRARRYKRYLLLQVRQKFEEFDVKPTIFSYNELRAATRDFHSDMKLGEGGYGAVYKGIFPNKSEVAVKQLFVKNTQGIDEFLNEVVLITGMKHRNLVNLKGCCLREHQRLLIYEYVDNYDIDQILLRGDKKTPLGWAVRLNICLGVARGLHYLHALAHPRIIHRDIKARNVLLDKNFEPKIADFGLALLFPDEKSHIMTVHVAGTKGYLAPEYASLGQLSEKVDVFSFGILCLEVLSGRQNIDESKPLDQVYLSKWAWKLHSEGKCIDLIDPALRLQDGEAPQAERLTNIALLCAHHDAEQRPSMARVVAMLQNDTESEVVLLPAADEKQHSSSESIDTVRLLAFGNYAVDSALTTVPEGVESPRPSPSFQNNINSTNINTARTSGRRGGGQGSFHGSDRGEGELTTTGLLQLSEMRAR